MGSFKIAKLLQEILIDAYIFIKKLNTFNILQNCPSRKILDVLFTFMLFHQILQLAKFISSL